MILDDYNSNLYLDNKVIHLTNSQVKLLIFLISNANRKIAMKNICSFLKYTKCKVNYIISTLNKKMFPYAKIEAKRKFGYYLVVKSPEKFLLWKEDFFKTHKEEALLLKLYLQKEILEKNIKTLEKKII